MSWPTIDGDTPSLRGLSPSTNPVGPPAHPGPDDSTSSGASSSSSASGGANASSSRDDPVDVPTGPEEGGHDPRPGRLQRLDLTAGQLPAAGQVGEDALPHGQGFGHHLPALGLGALDLRVGMFLGLAQPAGGLDLGLTPLP